MFVNVVQVQQPQVGYADACVAETIAQTPVDSLQAFRWEPMEAPTTCLQTNGYACWILPRRDQSPARTELGAELGEHFLTPFDTERGMVNHAPTEVNTDDVADDSAFSEDLLEPRVKVSPKGWLLPEPPPAGGPLPPWRIVNVPTSATGAPVAAAVAAAAAPDAAAAAPAAAASDAADGDATAWRPPRFKRGGGGGKFGTAEGRRDHFFQEAVDRRVRSIVEADVGPVAEGGAVAGGVAVVVRGSVAGGGGGRAEQTRRPRRCPRRPPIPSSKNAWAVARPSGRRAWPAPPPATAPPPTMLTPPATGRAPATGATENIGSFAWDDGKSKAGRNGDKRKASRKDYDGTGVGWSPDGNFWQGYDGWRWSHERGWF